MEGKKRIVKCADVKSRGALKIFSLLIFFNIAPIWKAKRSGLRPLRSLRRQWQLASSPVARLRSTFLEPDIITIPISAHHHPPTAILIASSLRLHTEDIGSNNLHPPLVILNTTSSTSNRTGGVPVRREGMVTILNHRGNRVAAGTLGLIMRTPRPEAMRKAPADSIGGETIACAWSVTRHRNHSEICSATFRMLSVELAAA